jgi:hypothetical protein
MYTAQDRASAHHRLDRFAAAKRHLTVSIAVLLNLSAEPFC